MNFITKHIAAYQIKKIAALPRIKQFIKIPEARSVGLIFDATDKEVFEIIKKFIQQVKEYTKSIHSIGFVDEKITPNYSYIKTDIDLFNKKELKNTYVQEHALLRSRMVLKCLSRDLKNYLLEKNSHQFIKQPSILFA